MKKVIKITVFDQEQYDGEWPPEDAVGCVAWFAKKLEMVPSEYRAKAKIEISAVNGYEGSVYANIEISYSRPETDDEEAAHEEKERALEDARRVKELRLLEELIEKYRT